MCPRVVSLVPSVTETLLAWGLTPVACTRFCEQPQLRHVGGTKNPDLGAIVALEPDLVVMDEEENRREDYEALVASGVAVLATAVRSVDDVASALSALAERLASTPATPVAPPAPPPPPVIGDPACNPTVRAFVPIWRRPYMALGRPTYGASLLARAGIEVVAPVAGPYPSVDLDAAASLEPDVVLAPSEPYSFGKRHEGELARVARVVFVDGKDLFWWGARSAAALQRLSQLASSLAAGPGAERRAAAGQALPGAEVPDPQMSARVKPSGKGSSGSST